jgi:Transposase IS4
MYTIELGEGKDHPPERPTSEYDDKGGKTIGLLVRLTEKLGGRAKVNVLDSGFCVLIGLIELRKKGVFAAAIVKKRRYWPKHIDSEGIKEHFKDIEGGAADCIGGTLDNVPLK